MAEGDDVNKNYDPTASDVLITTSKTASEQGERAPRWMTGRLVLHNGEHEWQQNCWAMGCTPIEQASASVGPMERRHPKLEALDAAAQDVFDNEGEIADRLIDQYSKAYNALADDLDAQARQIAAYRAKLQSIADNRCCDGCLEAGRVARAALEEPQGEAQ